MICLDEQMEAFEAYADDAFDELIEWMCANKKEIIDMARERMVDGFEEYGDTMWQWDEAKREREKMEEIADAVNYSIPDCG